jgi:hypothetical protein
MKVTVECQHCKAPFNFDPADYELEEEMHYGAGAFRHQYYSIKCPNCGKINRIWPLKATKDKQ